MKPRYLKVLDLFDAANRPSDVRVYDGEGNLKRILKIGALLERPVEEVDPHRIYPAHRPGYRPSKRKVSSRRRGKLRGLSIL